MQEIKIKNIVIGKQYEQNENLEEFTKIVNDKSINVYVVSMGNRINIEKNVYFDILWPSNKESISENTINNNALVCKFIYGDFSMLFTGDIEEKAESSLIKQYGKTNILQSNILKVAHHGSKSSSTEEFLELVNPQIALIGVGKNNLYGHPNDNVIKRITDLGVAIYRTDKNGEICIEVDKKFKIKKLQLYIKND
jgi:competence protein ComEC